MVTLIGTPSAPKPWDDAKRARVKKRIDKVAADAKKILGAHTVTIIATFADGDFLHMQDGGTTPMPLSELYARAANMNRTAAERIAPTIQ